MSNYTIYSPLRVPATARRFFPLNQNAYRNENWRSLSKIKKTYTEIMRDQVMGLPVLGKVRLVLTLFPKTKRKTDLDNHIIHAKFLQDAMVFYNKIPDDDYEHIISVQLVFGKVDPHFPRVEVEIQEV